MPRISTVRDLARFYYTQRVRGFESPTQPYLDDATLAEFRSVLSDATLYLEFGSGGSTVEAARRGVRTVSVDSDRFYAKAVRRALPTDAPVSLLVADIGLTREWGMPLLAAPTESRVRRWRNYTDEPLNAVLRSGLLPDLVVVDGRFRRACALAAAKVLQEHKQRALVVIDDYVGRDHYQQVERFLGVPRLVGRSAWFSLPNELAEAIKDADIDEAHRDFR